MNENREDKKPIWAELYRRRVLGVAAAYAILAWGLIEVASVTLPAFDAPPWVLRALIIVALVGCPIAIALSWFFDISPAGLKRTDTLPDLDDTADASAPAEQVHDESTGPERRQVCVLCCDFTVAYDAGQDADPEEILAEIPKYLALCEMVIARYEGKFSVTATEDVIAYFGADFGHEDDAIRAVMSALAIREGLAEINAEHDGSEDLRVSVKMGAHTGLVLAEETSKGSQGKSVSVIGQVPKVAAAIQAVADDQEVLISTTTYNLVATFFECEMVGRKIVRGESQEALYRVIAESESRSRLESTRLTDLFGREQELESLTQRWEQAKNGSGQAVVISGEPGIGKSRIMLAIEDHIRQDPGVWMVFCYCSQYHENSALFPIVEWIRRDYLDIDSEQLPEALIKQLEEFLAPIAEEYPLAETVPLFAPLLSLSLPQNYTPSQKSVDEQKEILLQSLVNVVLTRAQDQPVVFIAEDLHWADATTLEFITLLLDNLPRARILGLMAARTDFRPPWLFKTYVSDLSIGRLSVEQSRRLAEAVADGHTLPEPVVQQIIDKTDGVPLFVQELTRASLEAVKSDGGDASGDFAIPDSLKEFLTARIDKLGRSKPLAQLAATIGREFDHSLLTAIATVDTAELQKQLAELIAAEFIYKSGVGAKAQYSFRHALFQDAAYESLLKSKRKEYHQLIAESLEADFPETGTAHPNLLARHFSEAGFAAKAIQYWQLAGEKAASLSAGIEAAHHYRNGLKQVKNLTDDAGRIATELNLQVGLGRAIISSEGYSVAEVRTTYLRVMELCQQVGETPHILDALFGLWANNATRGETRESLAIAEQVRQIGEMSGNDDIIIEGDLITAVSMYQSADFEECRNYLDLVIARHDPVRHGPHAAMFGQEPGMSGRCYYTILLWTMGYADQALELAETVIVDARELEHMHNLAFVLFHLARFYADYGDLEKTEALTTECISLSDRPNLGFKTWLAYGHMVRGWAIHQQGRQQDGLAEMAEGLSQALEIKVGSSWTWNLSIYAECCLESGEIDEGLSLLQRGYDFIESFGNQAEQTELYRVHAEILMQQSGGDRVRARELLDKALKMAADRGAMAYDLRASISLAKLMQREDALEQAQSLLASKLDWFKEGKQSRDYCKAESLLQQLER